MMWTTNDDELLRKCVSEGMTAQAISDLIGRTRNSVIGRAHRLDITFKSVKPPKEKKAKKKKNLRAPPDKSLAESLLKLRHDQCRWPFETTFCEEVRTPGMSYCKTHHLMSFRPGRPLL